MKTKRLPPNPKLARKRLFLLYFLIAALILIFGTAKLSVLSLLQVAREWSHVSKIQAFQSQIKYHLANIRIADDPVGNKIGQPTLEPSEDLLVKGSKAMVACDVPLCSTMGKEILLQGGNAADAAITVALCIGSVNLHSSGIGGGGFIVSSKGDDSITIDAREMAPARAHKNMYDASPLLAQFGGLAIAVPGELAGLHKLFVRHGSGKLTWEQLFQPVIDLNRKGWSAESIWVFAAHKMHEWVLSKVPMLCDKWDFIFKEDGLLIEEGDLIRRENYADTLELIARNGSHAIFYDPEGPIAPRLAKLAKATGGILEASDFANYEAKLCRALSFNFTVKGEEYELLTACGISSGLALVAGLNFYNTLDSASPIAQEDHVLQQHRLIEAMKWTSAARSHLGDANVTYWNEVRERYTSREWAESIISDKKYSDQKTFDWKHYEPLYEQAGTHGTSHFSIVDESNNSVSMTTTVNLLFGSMVYDNKTGIILNDEMDDFSLPHHSNAFNLTPSVLNFIRPHKRPLSLMAPTIIKKNGYTNFLIGAAGGSRIVTAILQAIVRSIFHDMPLLDVIAFSRVHHQLLPAFVMVENNTVYENEFVASSASIEHKLKGLNHDFYESGALTAMNGIRHADGVWHGVSDYWRKHGKADGY